MVQGQLVLGNRASRDLVGIRRTAVSLAVALLALNILDIATTTLVVERFGAVEVNPLMAPLIGTPAALLLKLGIPMGIVVLAARVRTRFAVNGLRVAVALYVCVAISLIGQIAFAVV